MLRLLLSVGGFVALMIAVGILGPRWLSRIEIDAGYRRDIHAVEDGTRYRLSPADPAQLASGTVIAYRTGLDKPEYAVGHIVGMAGERIGTNGTHWLVDGAPTTHRCSLPAGLDLIVPAGHVIIATEKHRFDSQAAGPIPLSLVAGRITSFP